MRHDAAAPKAGAVKRGLALVALTVSCASLPREQGHVEVDQYVRERTGLSTHWNQGTPEDAQVAALVEHLLQGELTSSAAVEISLVNNPALQAIYESLGVSQADLVQAGLLKNPTLSGSVGIPIGPSSIIEWEGSLVQDFLDLFMLPLKRRVAQKQFLADTLQVAARALEAAEETRKAFVEVQAAQQRRALRADSIRAAQASRDLAQKQYDAGNINLLALSTEQASFEQARLELAHDDVELEERKEALTRAMGLWGDQLRWRVVAELPALPTDEPPLEHLEQRAMARRLDVRAERLQVELMGQAVELARTWRWAGRFDIGVHGHQDPNGPLLVGPTLSLELPIFDQRQAFIGRLEAEQRQAQRRLQALAIATRSEVRLARLKVLSDRKLVEHLQSVVLPLRAQVTQQTQLSYNAMQVGLFQLVAAKREQLDTSRAAVEALRDYWVERATLERLVGGQ